MNIYTSPMCQEVVRLAGVSQYTVKKDNNFEGADLAIVLSETTTTVPAIKVKLNTFKQIFDSINIISDYLGTEKLDIGELESFYSPYIQPAKEKLEERKKIKVKVYSNFIREIVEDMGFSVVTEEPDFLVFPDYMEKDQDMEKEIELMGNRAVKIPSHKDVPLNPLERAKLRYGILEDISCTII